MMSIQHMVLRDPVVLGRGAPPHQPSEPSRFHMSIPDAHQPFTEIKNSVKGSDPASSPHKIACIMKDVITASGHDPSALALPYLPGNSWDHPVRKVNHAKRQVLECERKGCDGFTYAVPTGRSSDVDALRGLAKLSPSFRKVQENSDIEQNRQEASNAMKAAGTPPSAGAFPRSTLRGLDRQQEQIRHQRDQLVGHPLRPSKSGMVRNDPDDQKNMPWWLGGASGPGATTLGADSSLQRERVSLKASCLKGETSFEPSLQVPNQTVLGFDAYFKEVVVESAMERERIRRVKIHVFESDQTIQIYESQQVNAGMPQGLFLRRTQVHCAQSGKVLVARDFNVGGTVAIHGRVYHVVRCADPTTRWYLEHVLGQHVAPDESFPSDEYEEFRSTRIDPSLRPRDDVDLDLRLTAAQCCASTTNSATLKGSHTTVVPPSYPGDRERVMRFLKDSEKVLRFFAYWDDRDRPYGDVRVVELRYYVQDDTMQLSERYPPNSGREGIGRVLCGRRRYTKQPFQGKGGDLTFSHRFNGLNYEYHGDANEADVFYSLMDLYVGARVNINGRDIVLYDADGFTREYYAKERGITLRDEALSRSELFPSEPHGTGEGTATRNDHNRKNPSSFPSSHQPIGTTAVAAVKLMRATQRRHRRPGIEELDEELSRKNDMEDDSLMCSIPLPPHNGFGTEEDSRVSCGSLQLNPPKMPEHSRKCQAMDGKVLRFEMRLADSELERARASGVPETCQKANAMRVFLLSYHLAHETLTVTEITSPNTGFLPGKIFHGRIGRQPETSASSAPYLSVADFQVGRDLLIQGTTYHITRMDTFTEDYCNLRGSVELRRCESVPWEILLGLLSRLREKIQKRYGTLAEAFRSWDTNHDGCVTLNELREVLDHLNLSQKEEIVSGLLSLFDGVEQRGFFTFSDFQRIIREDPAHIPQSWATASGPAAAPVASQPAATRGTYVTTYRETHSVLQQHTGTTTTAQPDATTTRPTVGSKEIEKKVRSPMWCSDVMATRGCKAAVETLKEPPPSGSLPILRGSHHHQQQQQQHAVPKVLVHTCHLKSGLARRHDLLRKVLRLLIQKLCERKLTVSDMYRMITTCTAGVKTPDGGRMGRLDATFMTPQHLQYLLNETLGLHLEREEIESITDYFFRSNATDSGDETELAACIPLSTFHHKIVEVTRMDGLEWSPI